MRVVQLARKLSQVFGRIDVDCHCRHLDHRAGKIPALSLAGVAGKRVGPELWHDDDGLRSARLRQRDRAAQHLARRGDTVRDRVIAAIGHQHRGE